MHLFEFTSCVWANARAHIISDSCSCVCGFLFVFGACVCVCVFVYDVQTWPQLLLLNIRQRNDAARVALAWWPAAAAASSSTWKIYISLIDTHSHIVHPYTNAYICAFTTHEHMHRKQVCVFAPYGDWRRLERRWRSHMRQNSSESEYFELLLLRLLYTYVRCGAFVTISHRMDSME